MRKRPHFEIVRTAAGWHSRYIAANGRIVWWTETYTRRRAARTAIRLMTAGCWSCAIYDVDERAEV